MPKVSVIVPIYRVEDHISRCANSLFRQTLDDIEYIFIDDCTPDRSIDILYDVLQYYPHRKLQTKVLKMERNSGQAVVRRYGVSMSTGEFIIHCDSDDWVEIEMYEQLYKIAKEYHSEVVCCDYILTDGKNENRLIKQVIPNDNVEIVHSLLLGEIHGSLCNKLVHRRLYEEMAIFPTDSMREDLVLMVQILFNANGVSYMPYPYYNYYINPTSITNTTDLISLANRSWQSVRNIYHVETLLYQYGLKERFANEISLAKFMIKDQASQLTMSRQWRKQWNKMFPELTLLDLINIPVSWKFKVKFVIIYLGVFVIINRILNLFTYKKD